MTTRLLLLLGALSSAACATAEGPSLPADIVLPEWEPPQMDFARPSGLRVLVVEDHSAPVVVVTEVFGVGGTSDPSGSEGLAHFVEHLVFRARPDGGDQVWDRLKRTGGSFNASTGADETSYYVIAPKDDLEMLMRLQALRMLDPLAGVTPEVFDTEREVVRNELRQRFETTVGNRSFDLVLDALFPPGHPLHRPLAGTHETLSHATLDEARAFVARHYRPENCTIVIGGDVDKKEVARLLGTWPAPLQFGPGGPGARPVPPRRRVADTPAPPVPPPFRKDMVRVKGPVAQPQLILAWSMPGGHRGNDAFMTFASGLMRGSINRNLRHKEEDEIEGLSVSSSPLADASVMLVSVNLKPGTNPEQARDRVLDAMFGEDFALGTRKIVSVGKWGRAASMLMGSEDPVARALATSEHLATTGRTQYYKDSFEELVGIKGSELTDFMHEWLVRDRAVSLYIEPENADTPRAVAGTAPARGGEHEVGHGALAGADLGPERIRRVALAPGIKDLPHWKLASGLDVYAARHGSAPIARVLLHLRGGTAMAKPYGLVGLAHGYVQPHCPQYRPLYEVGGSIFSGAGETSSSVSAEVMAGNLANAIAALSDDVTCMEPREDYFVAGFEQSLKMRKKSWDRTSQRPETVAGRTLWGELYPGHPYGLLSPDPDTLKDAKLDDMTAFMKSQYQAQNGTLVLVGDIDPGQAKDLAETYLARWTGGGSPTLPLAPADPMPVPSRRKLFVIDRPGATQAQIALACRLPAQTPETLPAFDVADMLLNDYAWKIREQWAATYGIHAAISRLPGGGSHMVMTGAVENAQVGASMARVLGIVDTVGQGAFEEQDFLLARWDAARSYARRFTSGTALASGIFAAVGEGWPIDVWDRYPERLAALGPDGVAAAVKPCLGKEIVTIVGDASVVRPQLEAAGLAPEPPLAGAPPAKPTPP